MVDNAVDPLLDGIYQDVTSRLKEKKGFKAWHKPRKHHIRAKQWGAAIEELIEGFGPAHSTRSITYLGMPAEDFLDVRALKDICQRQDAKLHYLGFDSTGEEGQVEYFLSRHEAEEPDFVDKTSVVYKGRIEEVADESSIAFQMIEKHGPFDVVNIDLCNSIAFGRAGYFNAIKRLCDHQTANSTRPWLLFLTTRVERAQMDKSIKQSLLTCVLRNVSNHESFASAIGDIGLSEESLTQEIREGKLLVREELFDAFVLGIGKWLLQLMGSGQPHVTVSPLDGFSYRVGGNSHLNMISLAYKIEPVVERRTDTSGLTPGVSEAGEQRPTEAELAAELLENVKNVVDVDILMAQDDRLRSEAIEGTKELLRKARYPVEDYDEWADANTPDLGCA